MHRFFCPQADFSHPEIILTEKKEIHHLRNVLRLKENDLICVFNERHEEAEGRIFSITSQEVSVRIQKVKINKTKFPQIILACALPKKGKFELIIEKVTELGVDEIIPMVTKRTEVLLEGKRREEKLKRFKAVALNAAKQSKRTTIPVIHPITSFKDALSLLTLQPVPPSGGTGRVPPHGRKEFGATPACRNAALRRAGTGFSPWGSTKTSTVFIPSLLLERENLLKALGQTSKPEKISFLIGPEGDFTQEEYLEAQKMGCIPVSLGETILKVETAAICAVACANIFYEH